MQAVLDLHRAGQLGKPDAMALLFLLPRITGARNCLEIGSGEGFSATLTAAAIGAEGHLESVDVEDRQAVVMERLRPFGLQDRVRCVRQDGVEYAKTYAGPPFDFVFEDGPHEPPFTLAFLDAIRVHLRPGGLIVVHDTKDHDLAAIVLAWAKDNAYLALDIQMGVGYTFLLKP